CVCSYFCKGDWAWTGESRYDRDLIIAVVDLEKSKQILRVSWHDFTTGMESLVLIGNYDSTVAILCRNEANEPILFLRRYSLSCLFGLGCPGIGSPDEQYYEVDLSGSVKKVSKDPYPSDKWGGKYPSDQTPMGFRSGPVFDALVTQNKGRILAKVQPDPERLLFYRDFMIGTVKRDGSDEQQIFPRVDQLEQIP
ncbi:MAG: hypothetical protein ABIH23_23990, partial [bacterium]